MIRRLTTAVVAFLTVLTLATPAHAAGESRFGRMFDGLPPLNSQTVQQLADLAQSQIDPNADADNNPGMLSAMTYFGQFVDHDLTLDSSPLPTAPVDPTTLVNARTFRFDLDSVYGNGPSGSPQLYAADRRHFLIASPNGVPDLPRRPDGSAIVGDFRNDENQIISQVHVAFLLFHNRLVDRGLTFDQARTSTIRVYQTIVLTEFLPHVTRPSLVDGFIANRLPRFYRPGNPNNPMTPIEFSVAAYRFGHSMVRLAYEVTNTSGKVQVFRTDSGPDLRGGRPLTADRLIDWGNFIPELVRPENTVHRNISRKIDPLISRSLFQFPTPPPFRTLVRSKFYNLPSGQTVAQRMAAPVIPPADLGLGPAFANGTPLWFYILAESDRVANGQRLGPVGARIVAEVMVRLLQIDPNSILRRRQPPPPDTTLADVLVTAGLAVRP